MANSNNASLWTADHDFSDTKTGIVVRVSKKQTFRPVYSIQVSKQREDGKLVASIPVFISSAWKNEPDCVSVVARLMKDAVIYVEKETKLKDAEIAASKAARTKKQMGVG